MTENHPITPPPELVQQWKDNWVYGAPQDVSIQEWLVTKAARWGADAELDACCEWLQDPDLNVDTYKLRAERRRPESPSLKEQALAALNAIEDKMFGPTVEENLIRRALESLDD